MNTVHMSVHRALAEKKAYDDRIRIAMNASFVIANKKSNDKIAGKGLNEVAETIKGAYTSATSLIENKKRIVSAITASNAKETVEIAGKAYTRAEAINRKECIKLEEQLLAVLKSQFTREKSKVENENATLPNKLESHLISALGNDKTGRKPEDVE
jgi:hypothetical protein